MEVIASMFLWEIRHARRDREAWCFSHPTTAATSQERSCLSMAALHKFEPS